MRSARSIMLAVVAGLVLACGDGTLPTSPAEESPSFGVARTPEQIRHDDLKELLATERARLKRERELRKDTFEVAEAEWKAYREGLKRAKKLKVGVAELLRCHPRPFEGDAEIIGPDGGTLHIGEHELVIPRGALSDEQLIVAEAPTSSLADVEFSPEGLLFQRPARLVLSYKDCDVPAGVDLRVAYLGVGNRILEWPSSDDDRAQSQVTGEIHHFSRYAVAY